MSQNETICHCLGVDSQTIREAISEKSASSVEEIQDITGAGTGCGGCVEDIESILAEGSSSCGCGDKAPKTCGCSH